MAKKNKPKRIRRRNEQTTTTQIAQIERHSFSGPLPPPAIIEHYNQIVPGAAERILVMAESDANHQRKMESTALQCANDETRRGQIFGMLIACLALVASIVALWLGSEKLAMVIGGTTVVGLVAVFVTGRVIKGR